MKLQTKKFTKSLIFTAMALSLSACELVESDDDEEEVAENSAPSITSSVVLTAESGSDYSYTLTATDADGDALTMTATSLPSWLMFDATTGVLSGMPSANDEGGHSVTLTVSDGVDSTTQSFTINVSVPAVNNAPVITSTGVDSATEQSAYSYTLTATDADDDSLTLAATTLPSWLSFDANTGVLSGTPAASDAGDHNVVLTASDGEDTATESFTITVSALVVDTTPTEGALTIFADSIQSGWMAWDDSGEYPPVVVTDDAEHGQAVEFKITGSTVVGFTTRESHGMSNGIIHNASSIVDQGTFSFDLKMTQAPSAGSVSWFVKLESTEGDTLKAVELNLMDSQEGHNEPVLDTWQTYTFNLKTLQDRGLDLSFVDIAMVFPQWGQGDGAMYLLDNVMFNADGSDYDQNVNNPDPTGELITNTTLDSSTGWGGTDGMADSITNGVFTADVASAGNAWDVSLKYGLSLTPNTAYTLSFDARSDDSRDVIAGLGLDNAPWDNVTQTVSLTPDWTTYTLTLTTGNFGGNTDRVFFDMGASAGHLQLDNISLKEASNDNGDGGDGGTLSSYCNTAVYHFGNTAQTDSMALLTIEKTAANTLTYTVASDDDDPIDVLVLAGAHGGTPSAQDTSVAGQISQSLTWDTPPTDVTFNVLWSFGSFAGNWQLSENEITTAFDVSCSGDAGNGDGGDGSTDTSPQTAAPAPSVDSADAISIFSDAYTNVDGVNVNPNWGQATVTSVVDVASNDTVSMAGLNYQGFEFAETDLSGKATLNIDYWTADATSFEVYLISPGPAEAAYNVTATQGSWQTLSISLAEYSSVVDLSKVFQFKFVAADSPTIYFDNIYFSGTGDFASNNNSDTAQPGDGLVSTGDFSATTGWGGTDGMVDSIANGMFTANVGAAGNAWDVSLKYSLSLSPNTTYTLKFDARSDDSRTVIAGIGLDNAPWDNVTETVTLSSDWTTYTLTLTTGNFGGNTDRVFFDMGAAVGHLELDNVSLQVAAD